MLIVPATSTVSAGCSWSPKIVLKPDSWIRFFSLVKLDCQSFIIILMSLGIVFRSNSVGGAFYESDFLTCANTNWQHDSAVTSVFGWWTFPDLRLGNVSAEGQPTRPTRPSIPHGSRGWRPLNGRSGLRMVVSRRSGPVGAGHAFGIGCTSCDNSVLETISFHEN